MKLSYENPRFILACTYDERFYAKDNRFRWDPGKKQWWTDDPEKALGLLAYADEDAAKILEGAHQRKTAAIQESLAQDSDLNIPAPEGLTYKPFQKAGIQYAVNRENTLIGDEMGLGKTIQALGLINYKQLSKILIVCPATLKINWQREAQKWLVSDLSIQVVSGGDRIGPDANIVIINYDILERHQPTLEKTEWDLVIADEVHYCKNHKAHRSKALYTIAKQAKQKLYLTGTPIVNRPSELFPIIASLKAPVASFWPYMKRYASAYQTQWGWDMSGAAHLDELQEKLRAQVMIRRLKKDVVKELPDKIRQIIELPTNGLASQIAKEQTFLNNHEEHVKELKKARKKAKEEDNKGAYNAAVKALFAAEQVAFTEMSKLRHETAVKKIPYCLDHIKDLLESTEKIIVFAHHQDVIEGLRSGLKDVVTLTGGDSLKARQTAVDEFQNGSARVFIGSIQASAVGITLTAASTVVFCELDWTPSSLSQAEDRAHRIGQENSVLVQHLVVNGSFDAKLAQTVVDKQEIIEQALDHWEPEEIDFSQAGALIEEVQEKTRKQHKYTDEEKRNLHQACMQLSEVCDGAVREDSMGFNGADTRIGKSFALKGIHTDKQAQYAKMILKKYHRQLDPELFTTIYGDKENEI